jgi:hypothetical protein
MKTLYSYKAGQSNLPQFILEMLAAPPHAGEGVHNWLFRVARHLHAHLPAPEIVAMLESRVQGCGRHVSRNEIEDAVKNALACAWQPHGNAVPIQSAPKKWPDVNQEQRAAILRDNGGLADLQEASKPRIEDAAQHTEEIIDRLFPGNPLLCCGKDSSVFDTKPREEWRGQMSALALIVPSPMSALSGKKKNPKPGESERSAHTLDNTGERRFLICEFDTGTADEHAALLFNLGTIAPLVCAVHSGGKSLHGWFYVHGQPAATVEKFFRYAVSLGADRATWTRSQFVRMPDGTRDNGKRQTVYFTNFKSMEAAL